MARARGGKELRGGESNPSTPMLLGMGWMGRSRTGTTNKSKSKRREGMKTRTSIDVRFELVAWLLFDCNMIVVVVLLSPPLYIPKAINI